MITPVPFPPFRRVLPLCLLLYAAFLFACAPKQTVVPPPAPPLAQTPSDDATGEIWNRFVSRAGTAEIMSGPFRIAATVRYTDQSGKNQRASALLWGNGEKQTPYPLRLDLTAGPGVTVAKARETKDRFLVFVPDDKRAYVHTGGGRTLASFGVPVPFSLSDLTLLLSGRGGALFLPPDDRNSLPEQRGRTEKGARFSLPSAALQGELELSADGAPVAWKELRPNGWRMDIEPDDANPLQPKRLRISHPQGHNALVVVREIARVSPPYSREQLDLPLPPGTETRPLEEEPPTKETP